MQASAKKIEELIGNTKQQFVVPLFQRTYTWNKIQWQPLWDDISDFLDNDEDVQDVSVEHFFGSIVIISLNDTATPQFLLIDGQQRLTTIFILLALIRNLTKDDELAEEIYESYLINKFAKGDDFYRLQPTQKDRSFFKSLIQKDRNITHTDMPFDMPSAIMDCYEFFKGKINRPREKEKLQEIKQILLRKFSVVKIELNPEENPYLIFESLNARGMRLTQADLIRNYFFMEIAKLGISTDEQEQIYAEKWYPMQEKLGKNLEDYIRHYLIAHKRSFVKQTDVYSKLKNYITDNKKFQSCDILSYLDELVTYSNYYQKILYPENEPSLNLQKSLYRIKQSNITVSYPFLLKCYDDYANNKLDEVVFCNILRIIENYIIRRFICDIRSEGLNKTLPPLYFQVISDAEKNKISFEDAVCSILEKQNYPNDNIFREHLVKFKIPLKRRDEKINLILGSIEQFYNEDSDVTNCSIEYILPNKPDQWWAQYLGDKYESSSLFFDRIGNITLIEDKFTESSFPSKKEELRKSRLSWNAHLSSFPEWGQEQIEECSEYLADILLEIYPYFGFKNYTERNFYTRHEVTGKKPQKLIIKDKSFPVTTWRDVLVEVLSFLILEDESNFYKLTFKHKTSSYISKESRTLRVPESLPKGYYVEKNLSAGNIYDLCEKAMEYSGYNKEDWRVEYY